MNRDQFAELLDRLASVGLARIETYFCEGPDDMVRNNPSGTMVLLHPGISVNIAGDDESHDLYEDCDVEVIEAGGETRGGMMAAGACDPTHYLDPIPGWENLPWDYWFIQDAPDED